MVHVLVKIPNGEADFGSEAYKMKATLDEIFESTVLKKRKVYRLSKMGSFVEFLNEFNIRFRLGR
ncbi:hypothetical protein GN244_ATG16904 [Phytophthora infestans]|uniref:Uncharacterized protein n=1 Tax=Phytophthora infestans TaxID=4787 RepID=A0A833STA6_PHYIN|nr:hypothetical protein GN244_ATG16904 [Phytophthora infestans]KAF4128129.1 hypothetical protein GN958_ATG22675 [Phytophthora infestans]